MYVIINTNEPSPFYFEALLRSRKSWVNIDMVYKAQKKDTAYIRVVGKGTFQNSHVIKKWLLEKIEEGCSSIVFDLKECFSMDSTFMGMLTGLSVRMKGLGREQLELANVSAHNMRLLETLGLDNFLTIKEHFDIDTDMVWEVLSLEKPDKMSVTEHMLEAHKNLIDTGGLASEQFKNVHKLLEEDLERQKKKQSQS